MKSKTNPSRRAVASARDKSRIARRQTKPAARPAGATFDDALGLSTIFVPVDFSPGSLQALEFAVSLAQRFGATIVLLHVLDPIYGRGRFDSPRLRPLRAQALAEAKQLLARVAERSVQPRVPVVHRVMLGVAYSVIVEAAAQARADLIVMGSEGRTGAHRFFVGSVAEKVVRHARCPVLVVR